MTWANAKLGVANKIAELNDYTPRLEVSDAEETER